MTPGTRRPRAQADPPSGGPPKGDDPRSWPVRRAESFGGILVRRNDLHHEVALIKTRNLKGKTVWTLPKGTAEEGESPEATALREVTEETGMSAEIIERIDDITYWFAFAPEHVRYRKTVHFYLMRATGGDPTQHDDEVDEVRFVPLDEAARLATYPTDRKILKHVAELARTW